MQLLFYALEIGVSITELQWQECSITYTLQNLHVPYGKFSIIALGPFSIYYGCNV